jgi:hypothetical protein
MISGKTVSALLMAAAVTATSANARAFCQTTTCKEDSDGGCAPDPQTGCPTLGTPLKWTNLPLTFRFSGRPANLIREDARAAIRAAFYRWSDTLCPPDGRRTALRFVEGEDLTEDKPLVAGARASEPYGIYFRDTGWPYVGKADSTLAQTNTFFGKESGAIEYADIEINTGYTGVQHITTDENDVTGADLQAVITHEVGHYIGLAHSRVPTSIMIASYCGASDRCERGKVTARRLADDDIAAVCSLYPPNLVLTPDTNPQAHACSAPPGTPGGLPSYATVALGFAVLAVLRAFRTRSRR